MLEAIGLQYREYERRIISHIKLENSCQVNQRAKCNILFKQLTTLRVFFFSSQFFFFFLLMESMGLIYSVLALNLEGQNPCPKFSTNSVN